MGVVEVAVDRVGGLINRARHKEFSFYSDTNTWPGVSPVHPTPTALFASSIGLCATTQVQVFGQHLKVPMDGVRCDISADVDSAGRPTLDLLVDVRSPRPEAEVAAVLSNAHAGCYAEQALLATSSSLAVLTVNGVDLDPGSLVSPDAGGDARDEGLPVRTRIENLSGPSHLATWGNLCFCSDEPPRLGGSDQFPIPIAYFCGAVGMSVLSEFQVRAHEAGLPEVAVTARTASHFSRTGSVLSGTVSSVLDGFDIHLDAEGSPWSEEMLSVLAHSMAGSWGVRALTGPVSVTSRAQLNGNPLDVDAYPRRMER